MPSGLASMVSLGFENGIMQSSDKWMRATVEGSAIKLFGSSDGSNWTVRKGWTDSSITGAGYVGVFHANNVWPGRLDNFGAGTFSSNPIREMLPTTSRGVAW